jgi:predicted RecB family nuclease
LDSQLEPANTPHVAQDGAVVVTSCLLEAFLACPMKCYLLSKGEIAAGNEYTSWVITQTESYCRKGKYKLTAEHPHELDGGTVKSGRWKNATWHFALDQIARTQSWEVSLQAVQRVHLEGTGASAQLVPIRFVRVNKLSTSDKIVAAFEALVLAKSLGLKVGPAKIIHGEKWSAFTVKANSMSRTVQKAVNQAAALLSTSTPPDLMLNRHCPECKFQDRCRKQATEKNDLSLLTHMTDKDIERFKRKGILTVYQLSYTFRPRRRIKRLAGQAEKYHHSLKALAIREQKIHVVGRPELHLDGTSIFFDVEGIPDRDFYYLIGVRIEGKNGVEHFSLWADSVSEEERIWKDFLYILSGADHPVLMHYGSYETTFLKRMYDRYGGPPKDSIVDKAIASSVNLLSVIYARVYFPTYSNSLKEIARFLGFEWNNPLASGLQSIVWRSRWEASKDISLRAALIAYNSDDCDALSLVTHTLWRLLTVDIENAENSEATPEIVHAESLGKNLSSKWKAFKSPLAEMEHINQAAYWSYQRDRVYVRTGVVKKIPKQTKREGRHLQKVEKTVVVKAPSSCPTCGKRWRRKGQLLTRVVQDLVFGRDSVKRRVVKYVFQTYICRSCNTEHGLHKWYRNGHRKWGWNFVAYFIYHIIGLRVPQLTMQHNLGRLFGFNIVRSTLNCIKINAADYYAGTTNKILARISQGDLIHADETRANIKGHLAYVWVLTNMKEVIYILVESREGEFIQTLLKDFKGVLVSDFYAAYEGIECPQQKCLIHLMRDLNEEILNNPFDQEMKSIAVGFSNMLKLMVATIDRHGLKKYFLRKHLIDVDRFYKFLDTTDFKSEAALKCKQRFVKNQSTLFTFLCYDGVPWNNNNAEHAIKAFARLRDVIAGCSSKKGIEEYLTLLSVAETCEYQGLDFLDFLRSGETDIESFSCVHRKYSSRQKPDEHEADRNGIV